MIFMLCRFVFVRQETYSKWWMKLENFKSLRISAEVLTSDSYYEIIQLCVDKYVMIANDFYFVQSYVCLTIELRRTANDERS